jgi:hypothetical protein
MIVLHREGLLRKLWEQYNRVRTISTGAQPFQTGVNKYLQQLNRS